MDYQSHHQKDTNITTQLRYSNKIITHTNAYHRTISQSYTPSHHGSQTSNRRRAKRPIHRSIRRPSHWFTTQYVITLLVLSRLSSIQKLTHHLEKVSTTASTSSHLESPFDDFAQDWKTTTHERDSWATRERRRSTAFGNISNSAFMGTHHEAKHGRSGSSSQARKGSILSMWSDSNDEEPDDLLVRVSSRKSEGSERERRGSVLSLFYRKKDEQGKDIINSEGR